MTLSPAATTLQRRMTSPLLLPVGLLYKLPAAFFCGVRLRELSETTCRTTVPYGWRSQNPFRSTYFAAQAMAAEMSTGALVLLAAENAGVPFSTLILGMDASFGKKATALATFTCDEGAAIFDAVADALATGEARTATLHTVGRMADGTEVSRFAFTWSVKARRTSPGHPSPG
jgi:hypothetical protein